MAEYKKLSYNIKRKNTKIVTGYTKVYHSNTAALLW